MAPPPRMSLLPHFWISPPRRSSLALLVAHVLEYSATSIRRTQRAGCRRKLDHLVQLLPARARTTRCDRVHLRSRIVFDQQHAEQDQLRRLRVEHVGIERM